MPTDTIQLLPEVVQAQLPQPIAAPTLRSMLQGLKRETMVDFNCHQVGEVVSFDPEKQTVSVEIQMVRAVYNQDQGNVGRLQFTPNLIPYPILQDVPVFVPSGGTGVMTFPIAAGDPCLLLFNDRDLDIWFSGGSISPPNSGRLHSLSDALAIVGFRNATNRVQSYSATDVEIRNLGGKIQVAAKIGISNEVTSLLLTLTAVMNTLTSAVTALTALNAKTGPSAATQIAAVTTAISSTQTLIDDLLK